MAATAQNTKNTTIRIVLSYEKKMTFVEQPAGLPDTETADPNNIDKYHESVNLEQEGKIQKDKKKPQGENGKDKGKNKLAYAPKPNIPLPPKREHLVKDSVCHHYKEVGHWKRNCLSYQAELKKRKSASIASTL
nr:zinc finger, CCHC-type [Tanacetum cinerariifolium]GEY21796.1 zinc finger, CCHC-type [Tanacetum cinerariifolium]